MSWPSYKPVVTVVDVLDAGACIDGVLAFVKKAGAIVGNAADYMREAWIQRASNGDGNGYGYGYGYGNGYGNG